MGVEAVTAGPEGLLGWKRIAEVVKDLEPDRPILIMVHGFRYCPFEPENDPHRLILSLTPERKHWKTISWPRHMGLAKPGAALGIGFGWPATGPLPRVAAAAFDAGQQLAELVGRLRALAPTQPLHIMAHSLGARVTLAALARLPARSVQHVILMSGAEHATFARAAMDSPAGRTAQVLNVVSGENAIFDVMFRSVVAAPRFGDQTLLAGLPEFGNWTDLRIDCPDTRERLRTLGFAVRAPKTRICHWSTYMRPGVYSIYRAALDPAQPDTLARISAALPKTEAPWWRAGLWRGARQFSGA